MPVTISSTLGHDTSGAMGHAGHSPAPSGQAGHSGHIPSEHFKSGHLGQAGQAGHSLFSEIFLSLGPELTQNLFLLLE